MAFIEPFCPVINPILLIPADLHRQPGDLSEGPSTADSDDRQPVGGAPAERPWVPGPAQCHRQGRGHGADPQTEPGLRHEVHHAGLQQAGLCAGPTQRVQVGIPSKHAARCQNQSLDSIKRCHFHQYRKSYCGGKTIARSSYLHNGNSCTGKTTSLYWIKSQTSIDRMQIDSQIQNILLDIACNAYIRCIMNASRFWNDKIRLEGHWWLLVTTRT